jgi:hypothetical protein
MSDEASARAARAPSGGVDRWTYERRTSFGGHGSPRRVAVAIAIVVCALLIGIPIGLVPSSVSGAASPVVQHDHMVLGDSPARRSVLAALSATTDSGSFAFRWKLSETMCSKSNPTCVVVGSGTIDTSPLAMVTVADNYAGLRVDPTTAWWVAPSDTGLNPPTYDGPPPSQPLPDLADRVEGLLGPREGAIAMLSLASPTGFLDLARPAVTGAVQTGRTTVDGVAVKQYRLVVDPARLATAPSTTPQEQNAISAALQELTGARSAAIRDLVSIDGSGFIRQVESTVPFAGAGTVTLDSHFSDFGCAGTVLMPGQSRPSNSYPLCTPLPPRKTPPAKKVGRAGVGARTKTTELIPEQLPAKPGRWSKGRSIGSGASAHGASIACPAVGFCVAAENGGYVAEYSTGSWHDGQPIASSHQLVSLSCLNSIYCVAVDDSGMTYMGTSDRTGTSMQWSSLGEQVSTGVVGAECTGLQMCHVAWSDGGGGAFGTLADWASLTPMESGVDPSGGHFPFTSLSCVMSFCMATDTNGGADTAVNEVNSSPSAERVGGLHQVASPGVALTSVSCAFESKPFCVAADARGSLFTYQGSSWSGGMTPPGSSGEPLVVSCTLENFCMSADPSGDTYLYVRGHWSTGSAVDLSDGGHVAGDRIAAISCATPRFCAAVTAAGYAYTYENPSVRLAPSRDYKEGWTAALRGHPKDVIPCAWAEDTPALDVTRGCAAAVREEEQAKVGLTTPPTTFEIGRNS